MTTTDLLVALARECPNGVSFDPMALRLLRKKFPLEDQQIADLKAKMFQLGSGLWFSSAMICDFESRQSFNGQANEWLKEYGCFSVGRLVTDFLNVFRHLATSEDYAKYLTDLGFTVAVWRNGGYFCYDSSHKLDSSLVRISKIIAGRIEDAGGTLAFDKIELEMPNLTTEALESIRVDLLPEIVSIEVCGVPCWCSSEAIHLPEDFSEKLTTAVDTLIELGEKMSAAKLEFALNLFYRIRFREAYALKDNDIFMSVCAKHYQGVSAGFPNAHGRRTRSPNTRFRNLGVPVGAKLVFANDSHIICTVLDDSNQVEYNGKSWSISALAKHLLGASPVNGFEYFSYDGEILRDRRLRFERADN